jgi:hypothetical protein
MDYSPRIASRITKGVLVKTFIEIALVTILVAWALYSNFHPRVRGTIDNVTRAEITGWAYDPDSKDKPVEVHLYVNEAFVEAQIAERERIDIVSAGVSQRPNHGFRFTPPVLTSGHHTIQVYVVRDSFRHGRILLPLARNAIILDIE